MLKRYSTLFLLLVLNCVLCYSNTIIDDETSTILFDLENCFSNTGTEGSASDYSEFTAAITNESDCAALSVVGNSLYRNNPEENTHSCTPGFDESVAMCVSIDENCTYEAGSDKSIRFDIMLDPSDNMTATLSQFKFYENAPENFEWINGASGLNNYPTQYGIRILKNGVVIYEESGILTENEWNQEVFTFSENEDFIVSESTVFNFELLPYCPIGNGAFIKAWDVDNIEIIAGCDPVNGGVISSNGETEIEICAGDGVDDIIDVELSDAIGQNFQWVITDADATILELPSMPPFNFDGAGNGTCLIWHLAFTDGLVGAEVGLNANDLMGSFDLSNPITVIRNGVAGGELTLENGETEITICAGDDLPDPLSVNLTDNEGENMAWVITDTDGNILGLPMAPPFDLDGAGAGTCLIWNLSFTDGLIGAEMGSNANDLEGCYDLSNPITVYRNDPEGGELTFANGNTDTIICVGDDIGDPLDVSLSGADGQNSAWVITDTDGNILGLPMEPPFDLAGAGAGTCLIWNLSFADGLIGAEVGENANNLEGCYDLSNPITVVRSFNDGGTLMFSDSTDITSICAGDGISDPLDVILEGAQGPNMGWLITDLSGTVLALPSAPPFDLEGAGAGSCLIFHIAFNDNVNISEGDNLNEVEGCYDVSNSLFVERNTAEGGTLSFADGTEETTICVGDGNGDPLDVLLENEEGEFYAWVITDLDGEILGLPGAPPFDLEEAGPGTCLIWNLSYSGEIEGAEIGLNANDLSGCYDLSNPITVIREATEGGMLETTDGETQLTICADDGESDAFDVVLTEAVGEFNQWVITNPSGVIVGLPDMPPFDLEGAGSGACLLWNLSYNGTIEGLELEATTSNLIGCFSLSNPITVTRLTGDNCDLFLCDAEGGSISFADSTTSVTICAGDDIPDPLDVNLEGEVGENSGWIITDIDANILALPDSPPFDLDEAGEGICLIWHISFDDGLEGMEVGNNVTSIDGCFDLSNPLTVTRVTGDDCEGVGCEVEGGVLTFEDGSLSVEICVGDSIPDPLNVILEGEDGSNFAWIITNSIGEILALPDSPPFDLDGAEAGVCLIWHLAYDDGLIGLELGLNANDLMGCFDLSNPVAVTRLTGEACDNLGCDVEGGSISLEDGSDAIEICAGDGMSDELDIILTGSIGDSTNWIITDGNGNILDILASSLIDLEGAGAGLCLIWHISYSGSITGLEIGANINNIDGCFDLSNQISVLRFEGDDCLLIGCEANGGAVTFADSTVTTTICADDGIDDLLDVQVTNNVGEFSQWIITDSDGLIVGVPATPPPFNLEGAGSGICLIWNISYDGEVTGIEEGLNANDITGCFDLSNSVSVVRLTGDNCDQIDCDALGGILTFEDGTTETTICVGDSIPDPLEVDLTNAAGDSMQWVITDGTGLILGLPDSPPFDLDDAGEGVCLIWNLSYIGEIQGAEVGMNTDDITGCHNLSNPIIINRVSGDDCDGGIAGDGVIEFSIYPNPTSDMIYIDFEKLPKTEGIVEIFDSTGRKIFSKKGKEGQTIEVNMRDKENGIFFVRTISGSTTMIKRAVKIK